MKKMILVASFLSTMLAFSPIYANDDHDMSQTNDSPPGLQGKGGAESPRGLENQEKTPSGWSKGKKTGWDHDNHGHNHGHQHGNNHSHHNVDNDSDNNTDNHND